MATTKKNVEPAALPINEARAYIGGASVSLMYQLFRKKELRRVRIGAKKVVVLRKDLDAYLERQRERDDVVASA